MKTTATIMFLSLCALAQAQDIQPQQIPVQAIASALPKPWFIESVDPAATVSGWNRVNGSSGIRVIISRSPYDLALEPTKAGGLSVSIPRVVVYIFPSDFEGKHVNNSSIFRGGQVIASNTNLTADCAMLIMDKFIKINDWYLFHNAPSYPDWNNPISDITRAMNKVPNQRLERTGVPPAAQPRVRRDACVSRLTERELCSRSDRTSAV